MSSSQSKTNLTLETELRHLHPNLRIQLARILDVADSWKDLAAIILKPDIQEKEPLFCANDICLLDDQKYRMSGSPTQALIEHWSTFGRKRPTIETLLKLLIKCQLYRAADFISVDVLQGDERLSRTLMNTDENDNSCSVTKEDACNISSASTNPDLPFTTIPHISYNILRDATRNFAEKTVLEGGTKLGEGAFGGVFLGFLSQLNQNVAIKKLKDKFSPQFVTELEVLSKFHHENLLPMIGYCINGPTGCLVYKYMEKGSLLDNLSLKSDNTKLTWKQRVEISIGTAKGINHLHTFQATPFIHRDIKSANILLDKELIPKVGDFGLARTGSSGLSTTKAVTSTAFGTSAYMAPEAFRGDVSVKLDTFSFGVVLLELLTSLSPYDTEREETDLLSYVQENIDEISLLDNDSLVGPWNSVCAEAMFKLAFLCTESRKKNRPTISQILPQLEELTELA